MRWALTLAAAAVVGVVAGVTIAWLMRPDAAPREGDAGITVQVGDLRPEFAHAGIDGKLWRASDFDGRPTLFNFWATWCAPCLREMPLLQSLFEQNRERLHVVGIAVDEPGKVGAFAERLGITYPIVIGTSDVRETGRRFGNPDGMLPYSVLVDAEGVIRWRHLGELNEEMLRDALQPLLQAPESD